MKFISEMKNDSNTFENKMKRLKIRYGDKEYSGTQLQTIRSLILQQSWITYQNFAPFNTKDITKEIRQMQRTATLRVAGDQMAIDPNSIKDHMLHNVAH